MGSDEPDFIVVGDKVALGPLRRDLAPVYARWWNEREVRRGLDYLGVSNPSAQEKWVDENLEATRLVLDFAFHVLQLRNVLLETLEWNAAGLAAYERAGFRRIGVRRGAVVSRGRPTNMVLMDAIPDDFGASVLR